MAWYTWAILILAVLLWANYTYPEKTTFLASVFDPINEFIGQKAPNIVPEENNPCPETGDPVCGSDGVTYPNICKAALEGIMDVTPGEC